MLLPAAFIFADAWIQHAVAVTQPVFADVENPDNLALQPGLKICGSSGVLLTIHITLGLPKHPASWTEQLLDALPL